MTKLLYEIKLRDHMNNFHLKYDKNLNTNNVKGFYTPSINYNCWITKKISSRESIAQLVLILHVICRDRNLIFDTLIYLR
jgi:hypothetical protein